MNRWNVVFKTFSNINKMKIVGILSHKQPRSVGEMAEELDISFKATSKHLIELARAGVLVSKGKNNHVYYSLNPVCPKDYKKATRLFNEE